MITKYYLSFGKENQVTVLEVSTRSIIDGSGLTDYQKLSLAEIVAIVLSYL